MNFSLIHLSEVNEVLSPLRSESGKAERSPWEVELAKLPKLKSLIIGGVIACGGQNS